MDEEIGFFGTLAFGVTVLVFAGIGIHSCATGESGAVVCSRICVAQGQRVKTFAPEGKHCECGDDLPACRKPEEGKAESEVGP